MEDSSEYHKNNIMNFPKHQKVMDEWVSIASKFHREIEKMLKAKKHHLLDLDKFIISDKEISYNKDTIKQLKQLGDFAEDALRALSLERENFSRMTYCVYSDRGPQEHQSRRRSSTGSSSAASCAPRLRKRSSSSVAGAAAASARRRICPPLHLNAARAQPAARYQRCRHRRALPSRGRLRRSPAPAASRGPSSPRAPSWAAPRAAASAASTRPVGRRPRCQRRRRALRRPPPWWRRLGSHH